MPKRALQASLNPQAVTGNQCDHGRTLVQGGRSRPSG